MKFLQFINKKIAIALAALILLQAIWPSTAAALTGGPSQPEVESFKPVGVTDMVDLFTGDFQYNIPLLDIEGYPINLSYQSNPGMDEEASWVGLGWSLNPGVINRDVRGFPDDFKGDDVTREFNMKKDETIGYSAGATLELFGMKTDKTPKKRNNIPFLTQTGGVFYNTYRGWGTELGLSPSLSLSGKNTKYDLGLNLQYNTQSGLDFALSGGLNYQSGTNFTLRNGLNSRTGLKDLTLTTGFSSKEGSDGATLATYGYDFGFAQRTYFPVSDLPLQNLSANVSVRLGPEIIGIHGGLNISGYYSGQGLAKKKITNNAYGYLFHSDGKKDETGLLDYNKEKERPYRRDMPIIPMPFGTYDVFSATGQGVSGQFRATRNDVAGLSKARYANASTSASVGIELGGGQAFRFGGDVNIVQSNSEVVEWKDLNPVLKTNMNHTESSDLYESVFFKSMGENVPTESSFYTNTGGINAVKVDLKKDSGKDVATIAAFKPEKNKVALAAVNISGQLKRNSREKRNQIFSYLDAEEATQMGLDRIIKSHPIGQITYGCSPGSTTPINRVATNDEMTISKTNFRQKHHISEISVTNPDGQRYVYGIPAYNNEQREVTFSVTKDNNSISPGNVNFGLVPYAIDTDNSANNSKGKENYFDRQIIPSYAYAYLITGVLSPDYVDRTGDGITDDDLGNAVKFNYTQLTHQYQWRVPFQEGLARLQAGRKSDSGGQTDDKGHYLYGKKEIWYVHSIESRNMVAQFYLSDREDAFGVKNENGGLDVNMAGQKLKKLDSIRVFSKSDLRKNSSNPTPIKTVIFEYDPTYPLCSKVPNNSTANRGKLTLKKVYFTYGKSRKGKLNAYVFSYGNNQDYSTWKYDRWGNYQNNGVKYTHNLDFPYTLQDPLLLNSGTWSLNQIILPSGGKINVEYEPDDYAYVQNRRATRMFYIEGYGQGNGANVINIDSTLYTNGSNSGARTFKDYVVINTDNFGVNLLSDAALKKLFLEDINKYIFFKANVLLKTLSTPNLREDVTGYFERDPGKPLIAIGSNKVGIPIRLTRDAKNKDPKPIHPITLATFQMMRLEMPEIAYNALGSFPNPNESFFKSVQKTFNTSLGSDLKNLLNGYEQEGMRKKWAQISGVGAGDNAATSPTSKRSFLRLCDPDLIKYGGGSRVKKITISDEWNQAEGASTYGQEYSYRTKLDNDGPIISSGVASYEPINGGEENPLREPVEVQKDENNSGSIYAERKPLAPTNYYYAEYPIGESLFPAPVVGYSEVTVKNLTYANVSRTATGYSKHRFYTAKDFPVITDFTAHQPLRATSNPLAKFLKFDVFDYVTASQGFVVETNDMHGKPESEEDYNESGSSIRFVQYNYKVDKDGPTKRLHNLVQVVKPDGTIPNFNQMMGVDIDVWQDFVEQNNSTVGAGIAFNSDGFFAGPLPIIVPVPIPIIQSEKTRLRTAATTKLIKRSGILDNVVVIEDGSKVTTKNVLFDSETGNVLLTETQNEFDDKVYNLTYPAHWAYSMMGQGYNNTGAFVKNVTISGGIFSGLANPAAIFKPGDEVVIKKVVGTTVTVEPDRYYITLPTTTGGLRVMNKDGVGANFNAIGASYIVKIVRSGLRNQASTSIGAAAMLNSPINTSQNKIEVTNLSKVINATALEFSEDWKMYCDQSVVGSNYYSLPSIINPFTNGRLGNWRPKASWVFYQERDQNTAAAVRPRTQGTVKNYDPFWKIINNVWARNPVTGWTTSNTVTMYDPRGNAVETQNPIGVYSSSQYGYNFTRVVAIADNAGYRDMAFEGFEETNFNCPTPPSLGMARKIIFNGLNTTGSIPHTGRNSALVSNGGSIFAYIDKASFSPCISGVGSFRDEPQYDNLRADIPGNTNQNAISFTCADCLPNTAVSTNTFKGGNQYNLSVWVATSSSLSSGNAIPSGVKINPRYYIGSTATNLTIYDETRSPIIDGWMRIECKIDLTGINLDKLEVRLENIGAGETAFFDDFRIHPWKSNMKSFVYDPWSMRLMAEMDENNYAMFYEYDDEGRLIRVKKETEKGVMTVKEARTQFKKNN
jgi:hypothetical protein